MTTQLDPFQSALLAELRDVVEERDPTPARRRSRSVVALATAAVGAAVAVVALPALFGGQAAFAVTKANNGTIDVHVSRLDDTAGLEKALADQGVRSQVTYLPAGKMCALDPATGAVPTPGAVLSVEFGGGGYRVHLDPGAVGDDQTLVIWAADLTHADVHGTVGEVATFEGSAPACRVVPAT